jgi:hypothetical protein
VPDRSDATLDSVIAACDRLSGASLGKVTYFGLPSSDHDWDRGRYHEATMGVELVCQDRGTVFIGWGDAWGHFALEPRSKAAREVIADQYPERDFSAHPWWAPFAESTLTASLIWREGYVEDDGSAPVALALTDGRHTVWIAAAAPVEPGASPMAGGGFLFGMNEVIVSGNRGFAETLGILAGGASPRAASYWRGDGPSA